MPIDELARQKLWQELVNKNRLVRDALSFGGTAEDCCVLLARQNEQLADQLAKLMLIAPRKIILQDGRIEIYRCPDDLVPISDDFSVVSGE